MMNRCLSVKMMVVPFSVLLASAASAANVWDGGSLADSNWGSATNWDDDAVPAFPAALTFGGSARLAPTNDVTGATVNGITFASGAGAFTLDGNPITLGGNISVLAGGGVTNDQTVNLPLTLNANRILNAAPVGGYYTGLQGALVINGAISGPYGLTATGKNYVQLNGANTYTGDTLITGDNASFSIGHANAFGSGKVNVGAVVGESQMWLQSAGNLTVTNNVEIRTGRFILVNYTLMGKASGNLTLSGNVLLNQSSMADFYCMNTLTLGGTVSGGNSYGLRLAYGKLVLQGVNTFTNHVRTSGAGVTFNINSDAALGHTNNSFLATFNSTLQTASGSSVNLSPSRAIDIASTNIVTFDVPSDSSLTLPGQIKNSGSFIKSGAGTLTLTGPVSNGGNITVNTGTVAMSGPVSNGSNITVNAGTLTLTGPVSNGGNITVNGGIVAITGNVSSVGGIMVNAGTVALSGTNTYGSGTTVKGGTLNINDAAALSDASVPLIFANSATLQAGATNVVLAANRPLFLTNAIAYTTTFNVPTNCTLNVAGPVKGNVSTNSALTKTGPGKLILTGGSDGTALKAMNILEGTLSIQGGTWIVAPAATDDSTVFNVTGGATYEQTGGTNTIPFYSCVSQQYVGGATTNLTSVGILSGGTLNGYELMIGRRNSAVMTISGNALLNLATFKLGEMTGYTTICNLDGGVVACQYIATRGAAATSILNLNGGTVRAKASQTGLIGATGSGTTAYLTTVNVKSGGAIIDSQGYAVGIPQILGHDPDLGATPDGGLIKRGTGTLTLSTNNTYTGVTSVEAGTFKLGVSNALWSGGSVQVASNAVLDVAGKTQTLAGLGGSGTVTNLAALTVTGTVAPGDAGAFGTLTLASAPASLTGCTLSVNVSTNGACDQLRVQGNLDLSTLSLRVEDADQLKKYQKYTIASCTGTLGTPFSSTGTLPSRWLAKYDSANKTAYLVYDFGMVIILR